MAPVSVQGIAVSLSRTFLASINVSALRAQAKIKPHLKRHTSILGSSRPSPTTTLRAFGIQAFLTTIIAKMASDQELIDLLSDDERPRKRARIKEVGSTPDTIQSLHTSISPPRPRTPGTPKVENETKAPTAKKAKPAIPKGTILPSPFQLTRIRDLPARLNVETVSLQDLICDPMIKEIWEFNYMHDLDFLMSNLDPDTKDTTQINVVHGYWKAESGLYMKEAAPRFPNIKLHCAYMPELFGTHHTKMMVLLRHDDTAQVVVHTANMIAQDWANMSQAVFKTPHLALLTAEQKKDPLLLNGSKTARFGSGARFKLDFLNYLRAYDTRRSICKPLIEQLLNYDFSPIIGALVGHVPGRHSLESDSGTLFGWPALKSVLLIIPVSDSKEAQVNIQCSSIATLGPTATWLEKTLGSALSSSSTRNAPKPKLGVIFPTADEIRKSLSGYDSGGSIHTKIQSPAQQKQLAYLKPMLFHWAGDRPDTLENKELVKLAGRKRAAPHIKTYTRLSHPDEPDKTVVDWALVTSANLSKQAWGEALGKDGCVRCCSYELGVLVAPCMFDEDAVMVPTFKEDKPAEPREGKTTIGIRMPYDLPLVKYSASEEPWCATKSHPEPDWMGRSYDVRE